MILFRIDLAHARRDAGGALVVDARAARTGAQTYEDHTEQRDASEVFAPASLATWPGTPVVVGHVYIGSVEQASKHAVGYVAKAVRDRGDGDGIEYVRATLVIVDAATIGKVERGELGGISMGYQTYVDANNRQTDIRINHLALGPLTGWARCGDACSIDPNRSALGALNAAARP